MTKSQAATPQLLKHEIQDLLDLKRALDESAIHLVLSTDGRIIEANDRFALLLGFDRTELIGQPFGRFLALEYPASLFQSGLESSVLGLNWRGEIHHQCKNQGSFWTEASLIPTRNSAETSSISMIAFEISERKAVQSALAASESFQRQLMDIAPVGVMLASIDGECTYINRKWVELTGFRLRNAAGHGWLQAVHPDDRDQVKEKWDQFIKLGTPFAHEYRYWGANGQIKWVIATGASTTDNPNEKFRFVRIEKDLTDRKLHELALEDQRARASAAAKMSALGEMATSIAHEINNPLAIIMGKADLISEHLKSPNVDPNWINQRISSIISTCSRIAKIIKAMRSLARETDRDSTEAFFISDLIAEALSISSARFAEKGISLTTDIASDSPQLHCRGAQVSHILLNLLNNAYDAALESHERWVKLEVSTNADFIEVSVTDSGPGISKETASKLFQPFFTTKPPGKGLGLGLSVSKAIAQSHGGDLFLDAQSKNTKFILRMPNEAQSKSETAA